MQPIFSAKQPWAGDFVTNRFPRLIPENESAYSLMPLPRKKRFERILSNRF